MTAVGVCFEKLFFMSKLLLVFPFRQSETGFYRSRWLTPLSLIHIIILICGIIHQIHVTPQVYRHNALHRSLFSLMQAMRVGEIIFFVICSLLSIDRLNNLLKELKSIDSQLFDYFTTLDGPKIWKYSCFYLCVDIIMAIIDIYSFRDGLFDTLFLFWTILINHILGIQVLGFIEVFLVRFTALSQLIKEQLRRKSLSPIRVIKLSKIHRSLSDCFFEMNDLLSVPLLAFTCSCFVQLSVEFYCSILITCNKFGFRSVVEYIVQAFIILSVFVNFYLIATRAQKNSLKAKEFKTLLYQLIQADNTFVLSNDKTLQLNIAWKKEVEFNVCGFFTLDLTLVQSMVGAVATYFVMILQFSERKNTNQNT
ncbi:Gustatory receptor 89b [Halyomorpha halys]|nr:Gustatory receptor 89b [Halyomorpha halys]